MASCVYDSLNGYGYGFIRCILEGTTVFSPELLNYYTKIVGTIMYNLLKGCSSNQHLTINYHCIICNSLLIASCEVTDLLTTQWESGTGWNRLGVIFLASLLARILQKP